MGSCPRALNLAEVLAACSGSRAELDFLGKVTALPGPPPKPQSFWHLGLPRAAVREGGSWRQFSTVQAKREGAGPG